MREFRLNMDRLEGVEVMDFVASMFRQAAKVDLTVECKHGADALHISVHGDDAKAYAYATAIQHWVIQRSE